MNWTLRILAFCFALVSGIACAGIIDTVLYQDRSASVQQTTNNGESSQPVVSSTGVRVTYEGWEPGTPEMQAHLKIRIQNDTWEPITYSAHSREGLFAQLTLNGKRVERFRCGTGMMNYYLFPGESVIVKVSGYEFSPRPDADDVFTVGFYLRRTFAAKSSIYRSEAFTLPEEFRMAIDAR